MCDECRRRPGYFASVMQPRGPLPRVLPSGLPLPAVLPCVRRDPATLELFAVVVPGPRPVRRRGDR